VGMLVPAKRIVGRDALCEIKTASTDGRRGHLRHHGRLYITPAKLKAPLVRMLALVATADRAT